MTSPFPVFVGFDARQAEAAAVTEFSILEHASIPVEVTMLGAGHPPLEHFHRTATTAFTYARFAIPWLSAWDGDAATPEGRAFFCDCDVLVLGDVAELAALDMGEHSVMVVRHQFKGQARPRSWSAVMLMDCSKLRGWTPSYVETQPDAELMRFGSLSDDQIGNLPPEWHVMMAEGGNPRPSDALCHWSYLSSPDGGSWVDRSGSAVWKEWRDRWRTTQ